MRVIRRLEPSVPQLPKRKRVAGYARVSSGKDAMLHSLSAQISYYSDYIQQHREWEYVGVYADEALTGTKEERPEFQRMLADCRSGKIDMVITKSIARFARNTVTMLEAVRELKLLGVDVFFEKENIHSTSGDGEVMLTILASYAQEESRSVSENCKWRIRRGFAQGEMFGFTGMYGYRINKGEVEIDPEQADIVRMIFQDYISGMGGGQIAKKLRVLGVPCLNGGIWNGERIVSMIKNEKYSGNALLQKTFVIDHLSKKEVWNKGRLRQYFAEGTHPAIIDGATFEMAQETMEQRRRRFRTSHDDQKRYPFSGMIRCGNCGKSYKRRTNNGIISWQCATFLMEKKSACSAKQIPEATLMKASAEALGLPDFDATTFKAQVEEIRVPEAHKLVFVFRDGRCVEQVWKDRSRKESWTDEKRQAARERRLQINEGRNGK